MELFGSFCKDFIGFSKNVFWLGLLVLMNIIFLLLLRKGICNIRYVVFCVEIFICVRNLFLICFICCFKDIFLFLVFL